MNGQLEVLRNVDFHWVRPLESIWSDASATSGRGERLVDEIVAEFLADTQEENSQALGRAVLGQAGIGKTHLVGNLRRKVWSSGGWFVLLDVVGITEFWRSAALSFLTSLLQEMPDGRRQFEAVIAGVARRLKCEREVEQAFKIPNIDARRIADLLLTAFVRIDPNSALKHGDLFRALCLLRSSDLTAMSLAHSWLQGYEADETLRKAAGILTPPPSPGELVKGMYWIMSLAGPTLVAVDQIDGVVNPSALSVNSDDLGNASTLGDILTSGLLDLHNISRRGKTVITCLVDSWHVLEERGLKPFRDRFREPIHMQGMNDAAAVGVLLADRLTPAYQAAGFAPPFPSWPFSENALGSAASVTMTPRTILMRCDAFRRACLENGKIEICETLLADKPDTPAPPPNVGPFDSSYLQARQKADIAGLVASGDDGLFGRLLSDALDLYAQQIDPDESIDVISKSDPAQKNPPLHGRLTYIYHDDNDRERHFCFRALEHGHHISFQARLRAALTASGISHQIPDRHLLLVRRAEIPGGQKTRQLFEAFTAAGGIVIDPSDDDLRTFVALRMLRDQAVADNRQVEFEAWLRKAKPLLETGFFKVAKLSPLLDSPKSNPPSSPRPSSKSQETKPPEAAKAPVRKPEATKVSQPHVPPTSAPKGVKQPPLSGSPNSADVIPVGRRMAVGDEPVNLATKLLSRHTAIIAGSGSGKTVLLRRIVEEAALAGIPAIVIDPNNDLSRLGDRWPSRPDAFTADDDAKAERYFKRVDVVVWTPGVHAGNPIFLPVMPDFASLGDDRDERQQAVDMAAETLGPIANAKNALQRGILVEALRHFASQGGGDLGGFTDLLTALPDGLSPINNAAKLAAGMADQLHAAVATNPLLRAEGPILDPKLLFFGPDNKRTRVSVINLSGLTTDQAREDFVNRLQMTLFGWIKKNPSMSGLLYVIDEAQNFLPSGKQTLSLGSGVKLVAQARKYGLGMIVATQAPRGIYNQVVSNCTTQFFGKQNAPATIGAAQEIIAASGGRAEDIGKLRTGEFYFATDGSGKPAKIRTPICLSYHPANPPSPDEVVAHAKRSRPRS